MPFRVAVVGRPADKQLAEVIAEYEARAARYFRITFTEVRAASLGAAPPPAWRKVEGERLLAAVPADHAVIPCTERGRELTSRELAGILGSCRDEGKSLCFLIGGAYGLDEAVLSRGAWELALSRFTLPHEVARLVLAEQIYRAGSILRGEPYHK